MALIFFFFFLNVKDGGWKHISWTGGAKMSKSRQARGINTHSLLEDLSKHCNI